MDLQWHVGSGLANAQGQFGDPLGHGAARRVNDAQPVDRAATRQFADNSAQERRLRPRRVVGTEDHREPLCLGVGGQFEGLAEVRVVIHALELVKPFDLTDRKAQADTPDPDGPGEVDIGIEAAAKDADLRVETQIDDGADRLPILRAAGDGARFDLVDPEIL